MTGLKTQAVRLGNSYRLPVHILYRSTPGRLGSDLSFSDAIRAKYASVDEQELPSADFVYPKFGEADASELLQSLSRQLIQLNRIRIRMNVRNYRYLQRYSTAVSIRCEQLLNLIQTQNNMYSGVTAEAIRELSKIHEELKKQTEDAAKSAASGQDESVIGTSRPVQDLAFQTAASSYQDESTLILRILSASSRGNGTRERYMRELFTRLKTLGTVEYGADGGNEMNFPSPAAWRLIEQAETEVFHLRQNGGDPSISLWHSEAARQFFWRIQRAPETERRFLLEAGGYSSLVTLEKVLRTMDDDAFRAFAGPLLERVEESLLDPGVMEPAAAASSAYIDNDWISLYHQSERVFLEAKESSDDDRQGTAGEMNRRGADGSAGNNGYIGQDGYRGMDESNGSDGYDGMSGALSENAGAEGLINILYSFFEDHEESDWELFRTELIHAVPESAGDEPEEPSAKALRELLRTVNAPLPDPREQIRLEKETLFHILREERGSWQILRRLIMETIRRIAVIRENQKEFTSLADSIMNLSSEQWTQFKKDVRTLREEDLDIRALIPETILHETVSVSDHIELGEEVRENRERILENQASEEMRLRTIREQENSIRELRSRETLMQKGVRMSQEKLQLLTVLREAITKSDTVFTDTGRRIFLHTVLKNSDAGKLLRPSFRELSSEGREDWSRFVTELLHLDRHLTESGSSAGAAYFGKLAGRFGLNGSPEDDSSSLPRAEAAIRLLEQQRLKRTLDTETILRQAREAEENSREDTQRVIYRLLPRDRQNTPDEGEDLPAFTVPDITVQRPAQSRNERELSSNAASVLRQAERQSGTESYTDIEFETVRHTVREEESREMKSVTETLERHERDIEGLLKAQRQNAERDLPREVIRQINDMLRMERLRGGR